jgi:hypothetical protein
MPDDPRGFFNDGKVIALSEDCPDTRHQVSNQLYVTSVKVRRCPSPELDTMATFIESPKAIAAYEGRQHGASQADFSHMVLPMLYAIVGISLGTLAGASLALTTVPTGNSLVYYHSAPASSPASSSVTQAAALPIASSAPIQAMVNSAPAPIQAIVNSAPAPIQAIVNSAPAPIQNALSAVFVRPVSESIGPSFTIGHSAASPIAPGIWHSRHPVKARRFPASQVAPARAPAAERRQEFRFSPEEHPSRPVAHPVTRPVRTVLASAAVPSPAPQSGQPNLESAVMDSAAVSSSFYTEGDLTVAAYDDASGTIQSSDGRTFVIGSTVSLSTAIPWSDYHADVHYRCAANGSCTLIRPGVVASNARLI